MATQKESGQGVIPGTPEPDKAKALREFDERVDAAVDDVMRLEKELRAARVEERRARVARSQARQAL